MKISNFALNGIARLNECDRCDEHNWQVWDVTVWQTAKSAEPEAMPIVQIALKEACRHTHQVCDNHAEWLIRI